MNDSMNLVNGTVLNECSTGLKASLVVCRCPRLLQRKRETGAPASLLVSLPDLESYGICCYEMHHGQF